MKASELREMSDEQLGLTLKETCENLFRLRLQAQSERLDAPSELKKQRRNIARIKTRQRERFENSGGANEDKDTPVTADKAGAGSES